MIFFQGVRFSRSWFVGWIFRTRCWICSWDCRRCWCSWISPTAKTVRRYDFDADFRRSIGSLWLDRRCLLVHQISQQIFAFFIIFLITLLKNQFSNFLNSFNGKEEMFEQVFIKFLKLLSSS